MSTHLSFCKTLLLVAFILWTCCRQDGFAFASSSSSFVHCFVGRKRQLRVASTSEWNKKGAVARNIRSNTRRRKGWLAQIDEEAFYEEESKKWDTWDEDFYDDDEVNADTGTSNNNNDSSRQQQEREDQLLLDFSIDRFLRGEYDGQFADDAPAPTPQMTPQMTVEAALTSLRHLDDPEPSHGAAVLLRFCVPLSRGGRWGDSSNKQIEEGSAAAWKEVMRGKYKYLFSLQI